MTRPSSASLLGMVSSSPDRRASQPAIRDGVVVSRIAPIRRAVRCTTSAWEPSSMCTMPSMRADGRPSIQTMPSPTELTRPRSITRRAGR